jgi:hypothetical protein
MPMVEKFPGVLPLIAVKTFYPYSRVTHDDDLVCEVY